jgi:hypothetical protein
MLRAIEHDLAAADGHQRLAVADPSRLVALEYEGDQDPKTAVPLLIGQLQKRTA